MAPNIIYINSHDTGRYIQPHGYAVRTPNLQRLAEQGVLFRKAFCAGPTCSPSRAGLVTGQCAHSAGMLGLAHRGFGLADYGHHIVTTLKKAGYFTALVGRQHVALNEKVELIGYDHVAALGGKARDQHAQVTAARELLAQRRGNAQPFYLELGFSATHREFGYESTEDDPRYILPPACVADTPQTRGDMARYHASVRLLDEAIGQVLRAVDDNGLAASTLVIATTDHGIAFPGHKCNLTDHGIGVFLIMRGPGGFAGGKVVDAMVSQVDLFPTICDVAGIERPAWLEGFSMLPLATGGADAIRQEVFAEVTYHAACEPQRCVRTDRWKYIRRYDNRPHPILPNCDDSASKDLWLNSGWRSAAPDTEQLYDLHLDPNEARNLAAGETHSAVLADMRARLDAWMARTNDPLLKGTPIVAGASVNDPDGLSPSEPMTRL
jgi:arylsulfatase A-like enzyme